MGKQQDQRKENEVKKRNDHKWFLRASVGHIGHRNIDQNRRGHFNGREDHEVH